MRAFKSIAERTRLDGLTKSGAFAQVTFDAMQDASADVTLPERLTPKSGTKTPRTGTPRLSVGRSTRYDHLELPHRYGKRQTHY